MVSKNNLSKLYRSESNRVLAGVCGGLGEYFDFDPAILRVIFVLITVFGGSGLLLYLILWIMIPTKSKLGKKSEDYIKENVEEIKVKSQKFADKENGKVFLGIILVVIGLSALSENFGFYSFNFIWKFWPILIILLGIRVMTKKH